MKVILQKDLGRKGVSGDIVEVSEGYASKENAMKGITSVKENAAKASIEDKTV